MLLTSDLQEVQEKLIAVLGVELILCNTIVF